MKQDMRIKPKIFDCATNQQSVYDTALQPENLVDSTEMVYKTFLDNEGKPIYGKHLVVLLQNLKTEDFEFFELSNEHNPYIFFAHGYREGGEGFPITIAEYNRIVAMIEDVMGLSIDILSNGELHYIP